MTSIFLEVLVEMCGNWYMWVLLITQNFTSGSILLKKLTVETQKYSHSCPFITAAKRQGSKLTAEGQTLQIVGYMHCWIAPVKGGFDISAHVSMLRTLYTVSKSVKMGQMSFYSMHMKYLEWPNSWRLWWLGNREGRTASQCVLFK